MRRFDDVDPISAAPGVPRRIKDQLISFGRFAHRLSKKYGKKAVRKNLTIPAWLNTSAEAQGVNFSQVLQEALEARLTAN